MSIWWQNYGAIVAFGLSCLGIAVAVFSLVTSRRALHFTTTTKGDERRMEMLLVLVEVGGKIGRCHVALERLRKVALQAQRPDINETTDESSRQFAVVLGSYETAKKAIEELKPADSIETYNHARHHIEHIRQMMDDVNSSLDRMLAQVAVKLHVAGLD